MSIQKVRDYFAQWGMEDRVMELDQSSATVEEAAAALHTEGRRIAKSMSFLIGDHPILVLFAGDARVDNHKFKERFHKKATMIKAGDVERLIGIPSAASVLSPSTKASTSSWTNRSSASRPSFRPAAPPTVPSN